MSRSLLSGRSGVGRRSVVGSILGSAFGLLRTVHHGFILGVLLLSVIPIATALMLPGCGGDKSTKPPVGCTMTVTVPNGGEVWTVADSAYVLWESSGSCGDYVRITLLQDGDSCGVIGDSLIDDGSHRWEVVSCCADSIGYTVRVFNLGSGAHDESDSSLTIVPAPAPCDLTVDYPNGGETLQVGEEVTINWEASDRCGENVRIELLESEVVCVTIAESAANTGSYVWSTAKCEGVRSDSYRVRITDVKTGISDVSDEHFSITVGPPECELTVIYPEGGEILCASEEAKITWIVSGECGSEVGIELLRAGAVCATLAETTENDGSHSWTVVECGSEAQDYAIRITDLDSGSSAESETTFTILPICALTLSYPNGGESFCRGDTVQIIWEAATCCGDSVAIHLLHNGTVCGTIAASTENNGLYAWEAETCGAYSDDYSIRITDLDTGAGDESDGRFSLRPVCELTVTNPDGGESYCNGDVVNVSWTVSGCCGDSVLLELTQDGIACDTLGTVAVDVGSYMWEAAQCGSETDGYGLRVSDPTSGVSDLSDAAFTISPDCAIAITFPSGGESFCGSEEILVTWNKSDCCGANVSIELLRAGTACATLAATTENDGSHPWTVAPCDSETDDYTIRITDLDSGNSAGTAAAFTILPSCALTLNYPNGGESFCQGDTVQVIWGAATCCGDSVSIELLHSGTVCGTIADAAANNGIYAWEAEVCGSYTDDYTIRITDTGTGASDESDAWFSFRPDCELTLTNPNGGEAYCSGDTVAMTWTSSGCCSDSVLLELTHDGIACHTLGTVSVDAGSYMWEPAQCGVELVGYKLRISDSDSGIYDLSDAAFAIHPECPISITYPNGGESFCDGEEVFLTWKWGHCCGANVSIDLLRNGEVCRTIAQEIENDGSYSWTAAQCGSETEGYTIRVTDIDSGNTGESETSFTIVPGCALIVTYPTTDEVFHVGEQMTITWEASDCCGPSVRIVLLRDGATCQVLASETDNDGSFSITVAQCDEELTGYTIEVTDNSTGTRGESGSFIVTPTSMLVVCPDGSGDYPTIQDAIDDSESGDTILLCDGVFTGEGNRDLNPDGRSITVRSVSGDPEACIIDCDGTWEWPHRGFTLQSTVGPFTTAIEGLTIRDGYSLEASGAVDIHNGSVTFTNCIFSGNQSYLGAVSASDAVIAFVDCIFSQNSASVGAGAIFGSVTYVTITNCTFSENHADGQAGAVELYHCDTTISDCTFTGNTAGDWGGAQSTNPSQPRGLSAQATGERYRTIGAPSMNGCGGAVLCSVGGAEFTNCTFSNNRAGDDGGAIACSDDLDLTLSACDFGGNVAWIRGGALFLDEGCRVTARDCSFTGGLAENWFGGGVSCSGAHGSFDGCIFSGNAAHAEGGALYCHDCTLGLVLTDCTFTENESRGGSGGGLGAYDSAVELIRCTLSTNRSTYGGGGLSAIGSEGGSLEMFECTFIGNECLQGGALAVSGDSYTITASTCHFTDNEASDCAGAIECNGGAAVFSGCTFTGNTAGDRGGAPSSDGCGGAVRCSADEVAFRNCTFSSNSADDEGGAIACYDATNLNLQECDFDENFAWKRGGALYLYEDCGVTADNCTFSDSYAENGGGVYCSSASGSFDDCSFTGNVVDDNGGALYCNACTGGLILSNCTLSGNRAPDYGGAVATLQSDVDLIGCTFSDNSCDRDGGAVHMSGAGGGTLDLLECEFNGNEAYEGGAISVRSPSNTISATTCTFTANEANDLGGAVVVTESGSATFDECEFTSNTAEWGGAIDCNGGELGLQTCTFTTNEADSSGGALWFHDGAEGIGTFSDCTFSENLAGEFGGGAGLTEVTGALFEDCEFSSNEAYGGGAIHADGEMAIYLTDCSVVTNVGGIAGGGVWMVNAAVLLSSGTSFIGNQCGGNGGAVYCFQSAGAIIADCRFLQNVAFGGGGVYSGNGSGVAMVECELIANVADLGGAVRLFNVGTLDAESCTFCRNTATVQGSAFYGAATSDIEVTQSIISHGLGAEVVSCNSGTTATLTCSDVYENFGGDWTGCIAGQLGSNGNIREDPDYCNLSIYDLSLQAGSPCVAACGLMGANDVGCAK